MVLSWGIWIGGLGMQKRRQAVVMVVLGVVAGKAMGGGEPDLSDRDHGWDFVTIGDLGNPPYPGPSSPIGSDNGFATGQGSVDYQYRIGRTEVTTEQWVEFLNATRLGGFLANAFWEPVYWGGVQIQGGAVYQYAVRDPSLAKSPIGGVPWRAIAYYCNWLHNGRPIGIDNMRDGAYDTSTFTNNPNFTVNDQARHHPGARYWIPTMNEWIKAAHYDPDKNGVGQGGWWLYPYGSDEPPIPGYPWEGGETSAAVDDVSLFSPVWDLPVGSYAVNGAVSPWGLLDLSGGALEWLEDWRPPINGTDFGNQRLRLTSGSSVTGGIVLLEQRDAIVGFGWDEPGEVPPRSNGFRIASAVPSRADFAEPWWRLTFADVSAFAQAFIAGDLQADLAEPYGHLDIEDIALFVNSMLTAP